MTILTEKEREDVYKYWLHSSTLTNEDGLIQLAEKAVLEKLAGMELPEPEFRMRWDDEKAVYKVDKPNIDSQDCYTATQLHQAFAQGAASQLSSRPVAWYDVVMNSAYTSAEIDAEATNYYQPLYTLKAPK